MVCKCLQTHTNHILTKVLFIITQIIFLVQMCIFCLILVFMKETCEFKINYIQLDIVLQIWKLQN